MDEKDFRQLSDSEFKSALIATLNLKKEWMASAESLNSGIKGFRAELHDISNLPFFFYRVCKIFG
jgi:hypothetical protein